MASRDLTETYHAEVLRRMLDARTTAVFLAPAVTIGAEVSITVPGGEIWTVYSVSFRLVTSAVAGNRLPALQFDDGTNIFFHDEAGLNQPPGSSRRWTFAANLGYKDVALQNDCIVTGIPLYTITSGFRIRTLTINLDPTAVTGDAYSRPVLMVARFSPSDFAMYRDIIESELASTVGL